MVYYGSNLFMFLSDLSGMPIDQINFFLTEFVALISGILFRKYLKPCPQNTLKRHLVVMLWGILLGHFCYGKQMWHLFCQSFVSYTLLVFCPRKYVHYAIFVFSMSYLSGLHIYRLIYDYGNYTLDISGPFMISTQKLTAFAFAYYDGMLKAEKLSPDQKSQSIRQLPHIIEFASYIFNFQGIAVGPLCFYQDYIDFITGNNILKHKKVENNDDDLNSDVYNGKIVQPDNKITIVKKLLAVILLVILYFKIALVFTIKKNITPEILDQPTWYRVIFLFLSTFGMRVKYYIAWVLADLVNNASGMGFNGYDEKGNAKWDLITNIDIFKVEFSTSIKYSLDYWNVNTKIWLRRIAFERLPVLKTLGVYVLSAVWHGFYPGYYFTFVTGAFGTYAGRGIRRKIRPLFQQNSFTKLIYSLLTWFGTYFMLSYSLTPFDLIDFWSCIKFYNSWYWWVTIAVVLGTVLLPGGSKKEKTSSKTSKIENENTQSKTVSNNETFNLNSQNNDQTLNEKKSS